MQRRNVSRTALLLTASLLALGCGNNDTIGDSSSTLTLTGSAARNLVGAATVTELLVNSDGSDGSLVTTTSTGADGSFVVQVPSSGAFRLKVTGGTYVSEFDGTTQTTNTTITALLDQASNLPDVVPVNALTTFVDSYASGQARGGTDLLTAHANANTRIMPAFGFPITTAAERVLPSFDSGAGGQNIQVTAVLGGLESEAKELGLTDRGDLITALSTDVSDGVFDGEVSGAAITLGTGTLAKTAGGTDLAANVGAFGAAQGGQNYSNLLPATQTISDDLVVSVLVTGAPIRVTNTTN
jgi:hypothetical protein